MISELDPSLSSYGVHTNNQDNQFSGFRPPSPPILGGKLQKSPPGLGDLGGGNAVNMSQPDLCVHGSPYQGGNWIQSPPWQGGCAGDQNGEAYN